jgi:dihydropyrimidinase|tara:strand:- start:1223 stop:2581 length:1359 start_codon:yes stop_codon:yes gene_type:complete
MTKYDTIIRGGMVVSPVDIQALDIGVKGEKIVARAESLEIDQATRVIDASGLYVLPGALDPHYHPQYGDDLTQGSIGAAHGGITTLVPFIYAYQGMSLGGAVDQALGDSGSSVLDFGAHVAVLDPANQVDQIQDVFDRNITSFKLFMAYRRRGMMAEDDMLLDAMERIGGLGGITMVHAENGLGVDYLEQKFQLEDKVSIEWFAKSRPPEFEFEAVFRAIQLAKIAETPLYCVHQTTGQAVEIIRQAQEGGQCVIGETCPQYLTHTKQILIDQGPLAICTPPYRSEWDVQQLWTGLAEGTMSTIGSDHSPHSRETKINDNVFKTPVGTPQVETLLRIVFQRGINEGRITLPRLVSICCENPARAFGLYPRKGNLNIGADADICMIDPRRLSVIRAEDMHTTVDYNTYEGWRLLGTPVHTMQRGNDVLVDGELKAELGAGDFIPAETGAPQMV